MKLVITIDCEDDSDATWLRDRIVPRVEEAVEDQKEEGRLDGDVHVSFDFDHSEE